MRDTRIDRYISDVSFAELKRVADVLHLPQKDLQKLVEAQCKIVKIGELERNLKGMTEYTRDTNDAHIVLGANQATVKFLVTYNLKHFRAEKIQEDFGTIVLAPAFLLQYLRSLN